MLMALIMVIFGTLLGIIFLSDEDNDNDDD